MDGIFKRVPMVSVIVVFLVSITLSWSPQDTLLRLGQAYAETYVKQYGADGAEGENGGDLDLVDLATGSADHLYLYQFAYGGRGGAGNWSLPPGRGGHASSFLSGAGLGNYSTHYYVYAEGGPGGYGYDVDGGQGGNAQAGLRLIGPGDLEGYAEARGGRDGDCLSFYYGYGCDGGKAGLGPVYVESTTGGTVRVTGGITGGSAGDILCFYGNGRPGAAASLDNAVAGVTSGNLYLSQWAVGGDGASHQSGWNRGGDGGSASSRLSVSQAANYLEVSTRAVGGSGGTGGPYNLDGPGGDGGAAAAVAQATNTSGAAQATASATGGRGGLSTCNLGGQGGDASATAQAVSTISWARASATARGGDGNGGGHTFGSGAGGTAVARASGSAVSSLEVEANQYGGHGGDGYSTQGGSGADSHMTDQVSGSADYLYLSQRAYGGNGGNAFCSEYSGSGGNASSFLSGASLGNSSTSYYVLAQGGQGGCGGTYGGRGGNAQAGLHLSGAGDLEGYAEARGGQAGSGWLQGADGGTASAASQVASATSWARSIAVATSGGGGSGDPGGNGGDATADSQAVSTASWADSSATARGGDGGFGAEPFCGISKNGGRAIAFAQGTAPANSSVNVTAHASGGRGGSAPEGGSLGKSGQAQATATGTAGAGTVRAVGQTPLASYFNTGEQLVEARATAPVAGTSTAVARTNEAGPLAGLADASGLQAAALATAYPEIEALSPYLTANATVQAALNGASTIFGYSVLGSQAASSAAQIYSASVTYLLNAGGMTNSQHLLVGLLDVSYTGADFVKLTFSVTDQVHGRPLFSQTFTDAAQALAFFDDRVLDLGAWDSILDTNKYLNLAFGFSWEGLNDAAFAFNFVCGSGAAQVVPLPGAILLMGPCLLRLLSLRLKRG